MTGEIDRVALLDSGFWFGLLEPRDGRHAEAVQLFQRIEKFHGLVPWPSLYEVLGTRLVRNTDRLEKLAAELRSPDIHLVDDVRYRDKAFDDCLIDPSTRRPLSLVDRVLRAVASDVNVKVHAIVTFNPGDFADVCGRRKLDLFPE
jgi:predicted nucleic acid-binding protein